MIHTIRSSTTNYSYIIEDGSTAIIVDPGESEKILMLVRSLKLDIAFILQTHDHLDHIEGNSALKIVFPKLKIVKFNSTINLINKIPFQIIKTPGHTKDSCCFYFPTLKTIFTGDTLFTGLCGRVMGGTFSEYFNSLALLKELPDKTLVKPGHEYLLNSIDFLEQIGADSQYYKDLLNYDYPSLHSNIGQEKQFNPFLINNINKFTELRKLKG